MMVPKISDVTLQLLVLLAVSWAVPVPEADPGRAPRVYNALITTNEKLLPSEVVPYSAPVLTPLAFGPALHPFPYFYTPPYFHLGKSSNTTEDKKTEDVEILKEHSVESESIEVNDDKKKINDTISNLLPITYFTSSLHLIPPPIYSYSYPAYAPLWFPHETWGWPLFDGFHLKKDEGKKDDDKDEGKKEETSKEK